MSSMLHLGALMILLQKVFALLQHDVHSIS
jgi:hypothetical protein